MGSKGEDAHFLQCGWEKPLGAVLKKVKEEAWKVAQAHEGE